MNGLSNDVLARVAPSIFADSAHESRSARYSHIPTVSVLDKLRENGFMPTYAIQSAVRKDQSRLAYTKHMVRFRHVNYFSADRQIGDVFPEFVMVNSHDGSSSYQLNAGLFRLVCQNGMVVDNGSIGAVRVQHTGNVVNEVLQASYRVLDDSKRAMDTAVQWRNRILSEREQEALAIGAHHLRFADAEGVIDTEIKPKQLLGTRRTADQGNDLWTVFNRVQEHVIRGGLSVWSSARRRRVSSREVKGIDENMKLNKALWKLAEHLASSN